MFLEEKWRVDLMERIGKKKKRTRRSRGRWENVVWEVLYERRI